MSLIDTPGLILPHQLTSQLYPEELKAVVPLKRVDHVTLRVGEGKVSVVYIVCVLYLHKLRVVYTLMSNIHISMYLTYIT